ncbi:MAG: carboxylesterase/lipase family protein [Sandaracinaceae bacterium]
MPDRTSGLLLALLALGCGTSSGPASDAGGALPDTGATMLDEGALPEPDLAVPGPDASPAPCPVEGLGEPGVVATDRGAVRGVASGEAWAFLGIPFAAPPLGELRWAPPEAPACIDGVLDAAAFGPRCPQLGGDGAVIGDEDCLQLNVWAPRDALGEGDRPVLFFVHGGGNAQGSTSQGVGRRVLYDGRFLAEAFDVVVVTTNYRLGVLGYLSHPELDARFGASGNYGLRDQIAALAWARRNLPAFGGDPERVLLFGESAGAVNTCLLLTSPLAEGLFSRALMQSGGCVADGPLAAAQLSAEQVEASGCTGAAEGEVECLRRQSPTALIEAFPPDIQVAGRSTALGPRVDGVVLLDAPGEVIARGDHNRMPVVIGHNTEETSRTVPPVPDVATYRALVRAQFGPFAEQVLAQYPAASYATPEDAYVAVTTDARFGCGPRTNLRALAASQTEPVYRYVYGQALESSPTLAAAGAYHGVELFTVFQNLRFAGYRPSDAELSFMAQVGGYWTRFAASGDPNGGGEPAWPAYDASRDPYLFLKAGEVGAGQGWRTAECDFWAGLVP